MQKSCTRHLALEQRTPGNLRNRRKLEIEKQMKWKRIREGSQKSLCKHVKAEGDGRQKEFPKAASIYDIKQDLISESDLMR